MTSRQNYLAGTKRLVVKVGSSTLTYPNGHLNLTQMELIVRQLSEIHNQGIEVVLVSSGAIAAGMGKLHLRQKPKSIPKKQATAAVGQGILMHMYEKLFSEYGKSVAQILLTRDDTENSIREKNAKNTFKSLLKMGVIPIVNENDAIATDEIKIGDNDTLSAIVAKLINADLLVILSDIDGMYNADPRNNPDAKLISLISNITEEIESFAGGAGSNVGTGGMCTKVKAAKIALSTGASMAIVKGSIPNIINDVVSGKNVGTLFVPNKEA